MSDRPTVGAPRRYWITLGRWLAMSPLGRADFEAQLRGQGLTLAIDSTGAMMPCEGLTTEPDPQQDEYQQDIDNEAMTGGGAGR